MKLLSVLLLWALQIIPVSAKVITNPLGPEKCVRIYYDRVPEENYRFGRTHALFLQNLLGHFPNVKQIISPIEKYKSKDIESCHATFYLGTHYKAKIPEVFYWDVIQTQKNVLWMGYHIWNLGRQHLFDIWKVAYDSLTTLDWENRDSQGKPGFYRDIQYKGETFIKYGDWDKKDRKNFLAAFELVQFSLPTKAPSQVLAWAQHSTTSAKVPYLLRNKNLWYMAESPFAFMTEDDRYLILSDVLFDVLDEKPHYPEKKPAFFRIEDIHAELPLWPLYNTVEAISQHGIPFHVAIIPIFTDPYNTMSPQKGIFTRINDKQSFNFWLKFAKDKGARWIMHGVTHQTGRMKNPLGSSGDDFEFWDIVNNRPLPQDSASYVFDRLELGWDIMQRANLHPVAWLTPHYQASPMNNVIFAEAFDWNIGRVIYFPDVVFQNRPRVKRRSISFHQLGLKGNHIRRKHFRGITSTLPQGTLPTGQFFPYEIYGDVFGQRLIPENIGNLQPFNTPGVLTVKTVDDMIATMKRNRVLRDVWASFFFHPFLLKNLEGGGLSLKPNDTELIHRLIKAAKKYNYEFISVDEKNLFHNKRRPKIIEIF